MDRLPIPADKLFPYAIDVHAKHEKHVMPIVPFDPKVSTNMRTIPPVFSAAPKTPPSMKRTALPYAPNLRHEKAYWQPKLDGIWETLNSPTRDPSPIGQLEAEAAAKCITIIHLEDMLESMAQHQSQRSDHYKMQFHLLLALLMLRGEQSNMHLLEAEELYENVLEEYSSEDEGDIKKVGERIKQAKASIGIVKISNEVAGDASDGGENVRMEYETKLHMLAVATNAVTRSAPSDQDRMEF